ncbi:MAG: thiol:disulfide interchange protein DsbA/DsbL [Noviherbaspirillum sp.]
MRLIKHLFAALGLSLMALSAGAAAPVDGTDYRTLDKPQATESGGKVEVLEFFWYSCPHCYAFEPSLAEWVKKQGDNIVFKRVPVAFRDSFVPQQKLYYSLEAMGRLDDLHKKVFNAIHAERKRLDSESAIIEFMVQQGVDKKKFLDVYNSFGVQTKARRAKQQQEAYRVDGVPLVAIDGRYLTSPSIVGARLRRQPESALYTATLDVMSALVTKAQAEGSGKK